MPFNVPDFLDNFMKALEKDAEERRKMRQVKEKKANGVYVYACLF